MIWNVKDTPRGHSYFRLAALTPRIRGFDASFLPTPDTVAGNCVGTWRELGGCHNKFRGTEFGKQYRNPAYEEWRMGFPEGWTDLER